MRRVPIAERANWRDRAVQAGFDFHTIDGEPYWDESAYYAFTLAQIEEQLEAPTAELRENQTDQDSLPPYDVLDAILLRCVENEESRTELIAAGFAEATVDQVLHLLRINEWKRHQSAPGPKVSHRAFGRERRYPISSGYRP